MAKEIILGIDLGTTNSVVSYMQADGKVKVIPNPEGTMTTPSVVAFKSSGEEIVGNAAKRQAITNPDTVSSIKRLIGTNEKVHINCLNKDFTPQEISAKILSYMKSYAEKNIGQKVEKAVITVPAYFNDAQRQATKDAGQIAGLEVVRIINEPTAAALAYGLDTDKNETILVFDLGGGTLDVSILEIGDGAFQVVSTSGDNRLGGDDWDAAVAKWIENEISKQFGVAINDKMARQRFKEAAEKAKIELSSSVETVISLPFIGMNANGPINFEATLTRAKFEELTRDLLNRCEIPLKKALSDAGINPSELHQVLLIGGSIRMPAVQALIKKVTGKTPNLSVNPDEAVSIGAAIQGAIVSGDVKDVVLLDVTPLTLGIETMGGVFTKLIPRNTTIPTKKSQIFSTAADGQTAVSIHVLQGEREMAAQNRTLGNFDLVGIPAAPRGVPQIEVTFDIDANGIVHVSAKDLGTGKEQHIQITSSSGLSEDEINRMVKDAEANAEADKAKREAVDAKNEADSLIYATEKSLKDLGDKVSGADKQKIEDAIADLKKSLESENTEDIKSKTEALKQASYKIAEEVYKQQSAGANAADGAASDSAESSTSNSGFNKGSAEDVDYEVHDDEK